MNGVNEINVYWNLIKRIVKHSQAMQYIVGLGGEVKIDHFFCCCC